MDRKHLPLVVTDQPVHNAVRPADELTHLRVFELWNRPARFRKNLELPNSRDELTHGDRGVVCGVLADEGVNGSEVGGPGRSRGWFSRGEPLLHLVMRNELARIGLPESLLDLRDEAQSLNRVLNRRWLGDSGWRRWPAASPLFPWSDPSTVGGTALLRGKPEIRQPLTPCRSAASGA